MSHILLIEPNPVLAATYSATLRYAGYSVAAAHGAQAAIDSADHLRPDAVVLELQLPRHGGVEFLYEFRSYGEWANIPVVIQSGINPQRLAAVQGTLRDDLGVAACLYKPQTTLQQLLRQIRAVIEVSV
jgi:CheY-like chemotaxis protein